MRGNANKVPSPKYKYCMNLLALFHLLPQACRH